jgi:hypothetical protein
MIRMPARSLSQNEIYEFSKGLVVGISPSPPSLTASGFWIADTFAVTCLPPASGHLDAEIAVRIVLPGSESKQVDLEHWFTESKGSAIYYDSDTGITVVKVPPEASPAVRKYIHVEAYNPKTEEVVNFVSERFRVASFAAKEAVAGDQVWLSGIAPGRSPELSTRGTTVTRRSSDAAAGVRHRRIYTEAPFDVSYRGAPVLNTFGEVVGIVASEASAEHTVVLIPATYITDALTQARATVELVAPK